MIKVTDLVVTLKNKVILDKINLSINDGERFVIIGPSGSGKSVLLLTLLGLHDINSGEIEIDSVKLSNIKASKLEDIRKNCGFLFQGSALFDSMTVEDNVGFPLVVNTELDNKEIKKRVNETLELVGLTDANLKKPSELSGGMQKRAALARAIIMKPKYIFYDEPTTGLDPIMSRIIDNLMINLNKELGLTSIIVTHDIKTLTGVADRFLMIYNGKIVCDGKNDNLGCISNPYFDQFLKENIKGPIVL